MKRVSSKQEEGEGNFSLFFGNLAKGSGLSQG